MEKRFRLPTEIPLKEYPKPEEFVEEAKDMVEQGNAQGIPLRVMGGLAVYLRISEKGEYFRNLWVRLGRLGERVFTDIDLASYGKYRERITKLLGDMGYKLWQRSLWFKDRYIFYGGRIPMVEVFFDRLKMNHEIVFKGRLELEKHTLPLVDLLLTKLQVVKINEKDLKDATALLRTFDISDTDQDAINGKYVAKILARDWGFYYTFTTNLKKLSDFVKKLQALSEEDVEVINSRVDKLMKLIESEPKVIRWKLRAKIGPRKKWYEDVEDWL